MAVADKFIMSDETAKGLVNGIKVGGFWGRVGVYLMLYVPMFGVAFLITISMTKEMISFFGCTPQNVLPIFFVLAVLPVLFFIEPL